MSGHINGVQSLGHQEYPFAHFVHCAARSQVKTSLPHLLLLSNAFCTDSSNAPRRKAFLTSHNIEFPKPSDTRWYHPARVINVLYKNYEKRLEVFDEVTNNLTVGMMNHWKRLVAYCTF